MWSCWWPPPVLKQNLRPRSDHGHGEGHRFHQREPRETFDELKALLAIPSISALPEHAGDVKRCAEWCADEMRRIGLQNVRLIATPGNPMVYGDWRAPGAPTILFYGHYDVQPVDPRFVEIAAVRGDHPRRRNLRARLRGRQGTGVHALQGDRGAPEAERPPAGEHEDHPRRRGGSREREPRRLLCVGTRRIFAPTLSSSPIRECSLEAFPRCATAFAGLCISRSIFAAATPTCTRDRLAARWPIRRSYWRRSSRR